MYVVVEYVSRIVDGALIGTRNTTQTTFAAKTKSKAFSFSLFSQPSLTNINDPSLQFLASLASQLLQHSIHFQGSAMSNCTVESCSVETSDGVKLHTRLFQPKDEIKDSLVVVLVHPYSVLGGFQGLLKGIASGLADRGYRAVTFDMRGAGRSAGRASLTGFTEIKDVAAVCKWVSQNLSAHRILLVGSSAGAPIAGSAVNEIEQVVGYVSLGYPFGLLASVLFGRHHKAILQSPKPKLFVMGTCDGFTSVKQLKNKLSSAAGRAEMHLIEGVSHFQMEGPSYDAQMVNLILEFIASL